MKTSLSLLVFFLCSLLTFSQSILDVVQFYTPSNSGFDNITLMDSSPSHVLLETDDANFTTSLSYESTSEYNAHSLLLCDLDLNVIWQKNLVDGDFMDATLGDNCVYVFGVAQSESFFEDLDMDFETGLFASKLDLDGNWEWVKFYPSLFKHSAWENTLETDSENNLLASVELWNYEHPASSDTLIFANEQCFCSALDMDFSICSIIMKWDEDGNELWSRVLDSAEPNFARNIYVDPQDNCYLIGRNSYNPEPTTFAGQEINGGQYLLSYSNDGEEQWAYYFSSQVPWDNAAVNSVIRTEENTLFVNIDHDSDSVVTSEDVIYLDAPVQPLTHRTVHKVDVQTGEFNGLDVFGHFNIQPLLNSPVSNSTYILGSPWPGFTHQFPPYSYEPVGSRILIKKNYAGIYSNPFPFDFDGGLSDLEYIGFDRIYVSPVKYGDPVNFAAGGEFYEMDSNNYVIILDSTTDIETLSSDVEALSIYPNPIAKGALNIVTDYPYGSVKVIDLQGRTVFVSEKMVKEIPIEGLNKGTYIIQLSGDDGVIQERFVVVE